jgi:hypothetical protein
MCVSVCMETRIFSLTYLPTHDLNTFKVTEYEAHEPVHPNVGCTGFVFV